ncbi:MAG TPA: N-acetylglucosamine-6-phosphate deacetylase [Vicinamibacterales bacterium]|nr:N-acetylglucosamine-6-phosphate deacetylase [Vicinamibacterales bacterium]
MILSGAAIVLPDRIADPATLVLDGERIADVAAGSTPGGRDLHGHLIAPAFIDVHVHGVEGLDALDGGDVIGRIAARLPRFGVAAFCPTSIACTPEALRGMLAGIRAARMDPRRDAARVLPAHLESNFINAEFKGAQPLSCICSPRGRAEGDFTGREILAEIEAARPDVGIVTLAPEVEGVLDLIPELVGYGHRVSLGHSGATYEQARAGIAAGARHATHLFNRMTGLHHRDPGVAGAVLESTLVAAEIICDGIHVHPAAVRAALAAKGPDRIMAITDGTGASGLPPGARATLGGRPITVADVALLDDGTFAGSVLTMDRAFRVLVNGMGIGVREAARMCATTPARELGLHGHGVIAAGAVADFVILDADLAVVETWISGRPAFVR